MQTLLHKCMHTHNLAYSQGNPLQRMLTLISTVHRPSNKFNGTTQALQQSIEAIKVDVIKGTSGGKLLHVRVREERFESPFK